MEIISDKFHPSITVGVGITTMIIYSKRFFQKTNFCILNTICIQPISIRNLGVYSWKLCSKSEFGICKQKYIKINETYIICLVIKNDNNYHTVMWPVSSRSCEA